MKLAGLDPYWGAPLIFLAGAAIGVAFYLGLIRYTIYRSEMTQVFATLGLSLVLQNLALMLFSADYLTVQVFEPARVDRAVRRAREQHPAGVVPVRDGCHGPDDALHQAHLHGQGH